MKRFFVILPILILLIACVPSANNEPENLPLPTATPNGTPPRFSRTPIPTPPTATPFPTYTPYPTYTPVTPIVIVETVVLIATFTPTPTPTPTPTATPTITPTPTATPRPPVTQEEKGTGNRVIAPKVFDPNRPLEISIDVKGTGEFFLNAISENGTVENIFSGKDTFKAKSIFTVSDQLNEYTIKRENISWIVVADTDIQWTVAFLQQHSGEREIPPVEIEGVGTSYTVPVLLQPSDSLSFRYTAFESMKVDLIGLYKLDCCKSHNIFNFTEFGTGSGVLYLGEGMDAGVYVIRVRTEPNVEWSMVIE